MARKWIVFVVAVLLISACTGPPAAQLDVAAPLPIPVTESPAEEGGLPLYLEHRGQFYRFDDLNDPVYRAASNDRWVREFDPQTSFAAEWADVHHSRVRDTQAAHHPQGSRPPTMLLLQPRRDDPAFDP